MSKAATAIIGGADGPTSVFVASSQKRRSLKVRVRNYIYRCRRKRAEKQVVAGAHTLHELVAYAMEHYEAREVSKADRNYIEQYKDLKKSLVFIHKPELLGEIPEVTTPDLSDEDAVREFVNKLRARDQLISEKVALIPDDEMPMDFQIYKITLGDGCLEMNVEYNWDVFRISYCGNKKEMKQFGKIARELHLYYGVSDEDIERRTERYLSLLAVLSA